MLNFQNRAAIALRLLDPSDRAMIDEAIARLLAQTRPGSHPEAFNGYEIRALASGSYLLRMEPWGIFFKPEAGDLVIEDIFPLERLEWLRGRITAPA
ncbi:hypothetical protein [Longimicrobium terrae]|uniref:Uncharacterized protein n=1 Tax=Longimicrobium terrae TaxID=1639882 RepID=A0A841H1A5_9BACT|nr:hypothetical protein [Longimicrobium terrae]MBB4637385.1 hypothetical protein [Longimicrobium terrae]MBB6071783.1 hypothetical protein [Longimicrobium terrae]NNC28543.1 hypothetical protein [Longimicrobium terrae]